MQIGGKTFSVTINPTVTASSAYTTGNCVGGLLTFPGLFDFPAQSGILYAATINCKSVQTCQFFLVPFRQKPTTTFTDKSAPSIAAADIALPTDTLTFASPFSGLGTHTIWPVDAIGNALVSATKDLYAVLTVSGTPTFTSASDLFITMTALVD